MCGNTAEGIANDRADDNPSRWTPDIDETMQEYGVPLTALDGLPRADAVAGNATNPRSAYLALASDRPEPKLETWAYLIGVRAGRNAAAMTARGTRGRRLYPKNTNSSRKGHS